MDIPAKTLHPAKVTWKLGNGTVIVRDGALAPTFENKVVFFKENGSIKFNHLTDNENGTYMAYKQKKWADVPLASYKLIILGKFFHDSTSLSQLSNLLIFIICASENHTVQQLLKGISINRNPS